MLKQTLFGIAALGLAAFIPLSMSAAPAQASSISIEIGNRWDRGHHYGRGHGYGYGYDRHRYHRHYYDDRRYHAYRYHYRPYDRYYGYPGYYPYRRWW